MQPSNCNPRVLGLKHTGRALNGLSLYRAKASTFVGPGGPSLILRWSALAGPWCNLREAKSSAEQQTQRYNVCPCNRATISFLSLGDPLPAFLTCYGARLGVTSSFNPSADRRHVHHLIAPKVEAIHPDGRRRETAGTPANRRRCCLSLKSTTVIARS